MERNFNNYFHVIIIYSTCLVYWFAHWHLRLISYFILDIKFMSLKRHINEFFLQILICWFKCLRWILHRFLTSNKKNGRYICPIAHVTQSAKGDNNYANICMAVTRYVAARNCAESKREHNPIISGWLSPDRIIHSAIPRCWCVTDAWAVTILNYLRDVIILRGSYWSMKPASRFIV